MKLSGKKRTKITTTPIKTSKNFQKPITNHSKMFLLSSNV